MVTIAELVTRLNEVDMKIQIYKRSSVEKSDKAYKSLQSVNEDEMEKVVTVMPGIRTICSYSREEVAANAHGEKKMIRSVVDGIVNHSDSRLHFYEGKL